MSEQQKAMTPLEERLLNVLHDVEDPEFPMSVVDMGLVYGLAYDEGRVNIDLTFTAMGCPGMEFVIDDIRERLLQEKEVQAVDIEIVWSPPWSKERLTEAGRMALEMWGISTS